MDADRTSLEKLNGPKLGWYVVLVVALMASLVIYPQMRGLGVPLIVVQILSRLTIVFALLAAFPPKKWFFTALIVLVVATIINAIYTGDQARAMAQTLEMCVLVYVIVRIVQFAFSGGMSINTIFAGVCVYLLLGHFFGILFEVVAIEQGHSILMDADGKYASQDETFYFSYVALTTAGFGDVRPINALGRSLSMVEALTGQLYLVLLLGRLVGLHISQSEKRKTDSSPDDQVE